MKKSKINTYTDRRNFQIESIRGIGILLIVYYHLFYRYKQIYVNQEIDNLIIKYLGAIGVALFFIISGCFIIVKSNENLLKYYIKKFLRLWPTYFLCLSITFILTNFFELPGRTVGIREYILNIFLLMDILVLIMLMERIGI